VHSHVHTITGVHTPLRPAGLLGLCCLGGVFHSAIELDGIEWCFGGHYDDCLGIVGMAQPLHELRTQLEDESPKGEQFCTCWGPGSFRHHT
jgi:hypothetical protein